MINLPIRLMKENDAPAEQYRRLARMLSKNVTVVSRR